MTITNSLQIQELDAHTLHQGLDDGSIVLIDVREPAEYAIEHIPGAKLHPLSQFDPDQLVAESGQQIVFYCQSGNRSGQACRQLLAAGFATVSHLKGGLPTWKIAGYPVETNPCVQGNAEVNL